MQHSIRSSGSGSLVRALSAAIALAVASSSANATGDLNAPVQRPPTSAARSQRQDDTRPPVPRGASTVTNCDDNGAGSFRDAVEHAADGDSIDLTLLDCAEITLTTGEVLAAADSLTIVGPGADRLVISGGESGRVLDHLGSGLLSISGVSIEYGSKYLRNGDTGTPKGGCVFSEGSVSLSDVALAHCYLKSRSTSDGARGGALYARYAVSADHALVTQNAAISYGQTSYGGGIYAGDTLELQHSVVTSNQASSDSLAGRGGGVHAGSIAHACSGVTIGTTEIDGNIVRGSWGTGGGVYTTCSTLIAASTISGNSANIGGGAIIQNNGAAAQGLVIIDSTIANNAASVRGGGLVVGSNLGPAEIENSTIAFNAARSAMLYGAGLEIASSTTLDLQSALISGNTSNIGQGPVPDDLGGFVGSSVTGANNLVFAPSIATPPGTLTGIDPQLGPLADNGGWTKTLAISGSSPARDRGNDVAGISTDQRGYARVAGSAADIGAYELGDYIFSDGFDGPQP
jgi:hypothetical protein